MKKVNFKISIESKRQAYFIIIALSIVVVVSAYLFYTAERNRIIDQEESTLVAISTLIAKQISDWYLDGLNEVQAVANYDYFSVIAKPFFESNSSVDNKRLVGLLKQIKNKRNYHEVIVAYANGEIAASSSDRIVELAEIELKSIEASVKQGIIVLPDLFKCEANGEERVFISFISTLRDADNNVIGALIFRKDPAIFLYPLLEDWPIPSQTAESIIFRVEADSILYLNNLRHKSNTALNLKISKNQLNHTSARVANGHLGVMADKDYRDVNVVANAIQVSGTPWYLISKVDKRELFKEISGLTIFSFTQTFIIILLLVASIFYFYRTRQKNIYEGLYKIEKDLWNQNEKFKIVLDNLGEGVIVTDLNAKIQYMNNLAEELTGWQLSEAKGRKLMEVYSIRNEETGLIQKNILEKVIKTGIVKELANHTLLITKNGEEIPVMDTGAPIYNANSEITGIVVAFQDMTEKRVQKRLLVESEAFNRSILSSLREHIAVIESDGNIVKVNKSWEQFALQYGVTALERASVGTNYFTVCQKAIDNGDKIATEAFNGLKLVLNGEKDFFEMEYPCHTPEQKRWFVLRVSPFVGDKNKIVLAHVDITQRKLAEKETQEIYDRINLIAHNIPGMIYQYRLNPDGTACFPWTSEGIKNIYGVTPEEVKVDATPVFEVLHPDDIGRVSDSIRVSAKELTLWNDTYRVNLPNGKTIWVEGKAIPQKRKNGCTNWHGVILDVTDEVKAKEELVVSKEKAEESDRLKTSFLQNLSHEIRTPMNGILGFTQLLKEKMHDKEITEMYVDVIEVSGSRLMNLISDLVEISKIETGQLTIASEELKIHDLFNELYTHFLKIAEEKGLSVTIAQTPQDLDFKIVSDKQKVYQILSNLLNNSIKFSEKGNIEYGCVKKEDVIEFFVKDQGIGIPTNKQEEVFKRFIQGDTSISRGYEGAGLGLSISKAFVEELGGKIWVECEPNIETKFLFTLPIKQTNLQSNIKADSI